MNNILDFAAKIHKQFFIGGLVVFVILVILMSLNIDINYLLILLGLILSFFTGGLVINNLYIRRLKKISSE
ncbi:hypothetical protein NCY62_19020 (plasmid) [Acinetobacter pittii]|jgi:hypothetical protein|nr:MULTISPECIES: hypothetical protein [Acinetobacter]EJB8578098.1 hypothetical protein [Acinetobacter baumannii]MCM1964128.1 hypothetical protein [Acinetobacter pittii]MCM1980504.1 hypothetical protein [Acinetobacter pittii]MDY0842477.1 hypothetical protein [Acinetobacter radioresistens]RXS92140.1 hypothetical protein ETZ13_15945 [Acinetobacter junii]